MSSKNEPTPGNSIGSFFQTLFWVKTGGVTAFMTLFFLAYFWALKHPAQPVAIMPLTAVDRLIPFSPWLAPFYFSLWIYVSICAGFFKEFRLLALYGAVAAGIGLIGLAIFVAWPTAVPRPEIDWRLYPSLGFLKTVDQSGNACPSLHVAYSVYSAIWADRVFAEIKTGWLLRFLNVVWCVGIVYSTIAIRQHVAIDVVCGGALGAIGALAFLSLRRSFLEAAGRRQG
jgi:membrane-associated phospholipid phosphatase